MQCHFWVSFLFIYLKVGLRLTDCWEFVARHAHHAQVAYFAPPPQIEQGQSDDAHLFVGGRCASADETGRVLARSHLFLWLAKRGRWLLVLAQQAV